MKQPNYMIRRLGVLIAVALVFGVAAVMGMRDGTSPATASSSGGSLEVPGYKSPSPGSSSVGTASNEPSVGTCQMTPGRLSCTLGR